MEAKHPIVIGTGVDAVGTMVMHLAGRLEGHLAQDLR